MGEENFLARFRKIRELILIKLAVLDKQQISDKMRPRKERLKK